MGMQGQGWTDYSGRAISDGGNLRGKGLVMGGWKGGLLGRRWWEEGAPVW